jgi:hypothetical protein
MQISNLGCLKKYVIFHGVILEIQRRPTTTPRSPKKALYELERKKKLDKQSESQFLKYLSM